RATIGNMSPEFGSTAATFPIDDETLKYLRLTGRSEEQVALVEAYAKAQGLWLDPSVEPEVSEYLELDLSTVVPSLAGPKRPQDRISVAHAKRTWRRDVQAYVESAMAPRTRRSRRASPPPTPRRSATAARRTSRVRSTPTGPAVPTTP